MTEVVVATEVDAVIEPSNIIDGDDIRAIIVDAKFKGSERGSPLTTELRLPAHSEVNINLRIYPLISFHQKEIAFSIKGDQDKKPLVVGVFNDFIKWGSGRENDPDTNDRHYVDYNDTYRISGSSEQTAGTPGAIGYKMKTRDPGEYNVVIKVKTTSGGGVSARKLTIIVEEPATSESVDAS
jgi:hypothetical protein